MLYLYYIYITYLYYILYIIFYYIHSINEYLMTHLMSAGAEAPAQKGLRKGFANNLPKGCARQRKMLCEVYERLHQRRCATQPTVWRAKKVAGAVGWCVSNDLHV